MEFRDLKSQYKIYKTEIDDSIQTVLNTGNFIGGSEIGELETKLSKYVGVKHCITCANGTEAMTLLMMAWGIKEGDAVFVPDFTFFSTGEIVSFKGATPVFVDVERDTYNMDPTKLEKAIQKVIKEGILIPKVIIPVDLFGLPANYSEIMPIAKKYNLKVLEDGAQGFGGSINDKKACSFGDAATTSFFPAKPLGCYGDGGAIFTKDDNLAKLIKSLKVHGKGENKYDNVRIGVNSRLDTIQAAVLLVKLKAFENHEVDDVNRVAEIYNLNLKGIVEIPLIPNGYRSSYAQYTIKLKDKKQRNRLQAILKENDIPSMVYYNKPMHKQGAFSKITGVEEEYTITDELCDIVLSLPMHPYLQDKEVEGICEIIRRCISLK
ncbi:DegT/DnrJ/EryC1/StrS aminotransferase family protein [Planococcus sp. CP5-4]|uniref:DegT/DnrJ/EryC1/StrS family aminotransferase n=1 Tax=unclassified Planococcus (in: firmicutes) TaxID=2662419 RepID=UPI001C24DB99|nr:MULTISPECIES: DegT/DnrJ/EryC1/StrS aminotransferase family protein [unclassified Planococcus (in: firmicutes)]MBU9675175.1 DegT/DnrJ/EryC1/StrS aminotransferase family protein [Planococcus sp. CP5-4_YE]MBV0908044.1 DegT/DnrJ/EryC1/StrS aminotransferase family protein [Planococcus sp. CP5-4_UN]MBW6062105.1 DegT/DnrJ/EryC1/StrS aminotransferase family protein [Planococcus sp. CP5-4]